MYVVEALQPEHPERFHTAYDLVGNEEEIVLFKKNIGSLLLGAIRAGVVEVQNASEFLYRLQWRNEIENRDKQLFENLAIESDSWRADRVEALVEGAARGELTRDELWAEIDSLRHFEPLGGSLDLLWINKNGLAILPPEDEPPRVWFTDEDIAGAVGDHVARIAESVGLKIHSDQYEMIRNEQEDPAILSDRTNISLGRVDHNNYIPVLTVLSEDHPVMQGQKQ